MALKVEKKIVSYALVGDGSKAATPEPKVTKEAAIAQQMNEALARPEILRGVTYKIKPPVLDSSLYITINDVVINAGTDEERTHPFEIFVNSKNMEHFQWIVGLTRVMSAVFRKGGDVAFLVEELGSVFDPAGGYFKKGGVYMPSLVAEIGAVLKTHLENAGTIKAAVVDIHQKKLIEDKIEEAKASGVKFNDDGYPKDAQVCNKCNTKAAIFMDGCLVCLSCADSKCS